MKPPKGTLAAVLAASLGLAAHGVASASPRAASPFGVSERTSPMQIAFGQNGDSGMQGVAAGCGGKEGSCKGSDGSCKGQGGSCKGSDGSCKGSDGSCKGKGGSCKSSE